MKLRTIKDLKNLKDKKVLLRVDFNVPLDKKGQIVDDFRIKSGLETIKYLIKKGTAVIILNHLGRPKGKVVSKLSNKPVAQRLSKLLKQKVIFVNQVIGQEVNQVIKNLKSSEIVMLENVRFNKREEENCKRFARRLASYADYYVNDAFAACHRQASSVMAITEYLLSYAGFLVEREIRYLSKVLVSKLSPKVAIIGGAKIETKVKVIKNLLQKTDYLLLGGAVANNILKAMDYEVGRSKVDGEHLEIAEKILNNKLRLPLDVVVAKNISAKAKPSIKAVGQVGKKDIILDLGPDTVQLYSEIIKQARLIVWNGPLGYFEIAKYKKASLGVAKAIVNSQNDSIIGGGETVQLIKELGLINKFNFVSTGGGAMLEFLEGRVLPGIRPLLKNQ